MENVNIKNKTEKQTKTGKPYWLVETDKGKFSVFDKAIADKLLVGKAFEVSITQNGQYRNLVLVGKEVEPAKESLPPYVKETSDSRDRSYAASYAKDIVVALIEKSKDVKEAEQQLEKLAKIANGIYVLMGSLPLPMAEIKAETQKVEVEKIEVKK